MVAIAVIDKKVPGQESTVIETETTAMNLGRELPEAMDNATIQAREGAAFSLPSTNELLADAKDVGFVDFVVRTVTLTPTKADVDL